jgi:hypothetical protein
MWNASGHDRRRVRADARARPGAGARSASQARGVDKNVRIARRATRLWKREG